MKRETSKAANAFHEYCLMGPGRSLAKVAEKLGKPSGYTRQLEAWSHQYNWQERARAYDEAERNRIEAERQAYVDSILQHDYALLHERVKALAHMAHLIEASYMDEATGKPIFQWLTPDKVREWRGCLDDIAKELGARIQKKELTGKDGGPIEFTTEWGGGSLEEDEELEG